MIDPTRVQEGMVVHCADGERLGTVIGLGEEHFEVEHGLLGRQEFLVDFADVTNVDGRHVYLSRTRDELEEDSIDDGGAVGPRGSEEHLGQEPGYFGD